MGNALIIKDVEILRSKLKSITAIVTNDARTQIVDIVFGRLLFRIIVAFSAVTVDLLLLHPADSEHLWEFMLGIDDDDDKYSNDKGNTPILRLMVRSSRGLIRYSSRVLPSLP